MIINRIKILNTNLHINLIVIEIKKKFIKNFNFPILDLKYSVDYVGLLYSLFMLIYFIHKIFRLMIIYLHLGIVHSPITVICSLLLFYLMTAMY